MSWLKKIFGPKVPQYTDPSTYPLVPKDAAITQEMGDLPKASYKEVRQIVEGWIPKRVLRDREIAMELNCSGLRLRLYRTNERFEVFIYDAQDKGIDYISNWYEFPVNPASLMKSLDEALGLVLVAEISNE